MCEIAILALLGLVLFVAGFIISINRRNKEWEKRYGRHTDDAE